MNTINGDVEGSGTAKGHSKLILHSCALFLSLPPSPEKMKTLKVYARCFRRLCFSLISDDKGWYGKLAKRWDPTQGQLVLGLLLLTMIKHKVYKDPWWNGPTLGDWGELSEWLCFEGDSYWSCWHSESPSSWRSTTALGQETLLMKVLDRCRWQACSRRSFIASDWPAARRSESYISAGSRALRMQLKERHRTKPHQRLALNQCQSDSHSLAIKLDSMSYFQASWAPDDSYQSGKWLMLPGQDGKCPCRWV